MAYSNSGGYDLGTELEIVASFANGLDVIANRLIGRAKAGKIEDDDHDAAALHAQVALVADRLRDILRPFEDLPPSVITRIDRLLCGMSETDTPSNVHPLKPKA